MGDRRKVATTVVKFAEATNYALISIDMDGNIEFVNPAACQLFGYAVEEMVGQAITIIIPERLRGMHIAGFAKTSSGETPSLGGKTVEVVALKKNGTEFPIEITLSIWRGRRGFCAGAIIRDISERREREGRLMRLASQDTLTGLNNRYQFLRLLDDEIASGGTPSVILLDLDGFKEVNDTHGHGVGDSLLQSVGIRLPYLLRPDAAIARLGGDEFAVMLPRTADPLVVQRQASDILDAFRKPFHLGGLVLDLAASLGIAIAPNHGQDAAELLASADFALYRAKSAGGRCYRLFDPTMRSDAQAQRATRDELRRALQRGELAMYYQPQVGLGTATVTGFEALIRWNHPTKGLLPPGAFLPALEQSALALDIGWWTLDEVCRQIACLSSSGAMLKIGVNLFPAQFRALNFRDKVEEAIERHGINAGQLELEVTEEVAVNSDERALRNMLDLREMGVRVAFDDFGTGFASLSSLQKYPITTLKIDRRFVADILTHKSDAAIAKALIGLSHDLGLETIAEGIESREQEEALCALGCPSGQGYLYGKAMPADSLPLYLQQFMIDAA